MSYEVQKASDLVACTLCDGRAGFGLEVRTIDGVRLATFRFLDEERAEAARALLDSVLLEAFELFVDGRIVPPSKGFPGTIRT